MTDIDIRTEGRAGRVTLDRPAVLNALSWEMCLALEAALDGWAEDPAVALVIVDGAPGRAFCAGGDILEMHRAGTEGRWDYGQRFWRDEYRMNAKIARFPKPVVTFLHGFTMGGGVGVGCHASHRVVDDASRVAMPECAIGLVPDVGGTRLLARAPGRLGAHLGVTGARMGPGDAIHAGFADRYVPEGWEALKAALCEAGDVGPLEDAASTPPEAALAGAEAEVAALYADADLAALATRAEAAEGPVAEDVRKALAVNSPLSMACTLAMLDRLGPDPSIAEALSMEYRFTHRALENADFVEGIRAQVVDKDRAPRWRHAGPRDVPPEAVAAMLAPLPEDVPQPEVQP
jgi:enoyl-CoA hydratase